MVSAINGVYQYSNIYQDLYFGTSISASQLDDLMRKFGIVQTGNEKDDLSALYEAMYSYYESELTSKQVSNAQQKQQEMSNVQWASVMKEVGLTATGDITTDYEAFLAQIKALEDAATSQEDKAEIQAFASQAQSYFVGQTSVNTSLQGGGVSINSVVSSVDNAFTSLY
ncbi:hypothetical protein KBA27_04770 [bacterium]|nr:hypothetical protein [bacterium]